MLATSASSAHSSAPLQLQQKTLSQARDTIYKPPTNPDPKLLCAAGRALGASWFAASDFHTSSGKSLVEEVIRQEKAGVNPYTTEKVKSLLNKNTQFAEESDHYESKHYDAIVPILILMGESELEVKRLRQYLVGGPVYNEVTSFSACRSRDCLQKYLQFLNSKEKIKAMRLFSMGNKGLRAFCQAYNVELL